MVLFPSSIVALLLPLLLMSNCTMVILAEKDSSYYGPESSNPNVRDRMYWKEAINVLEDLDKFDKLYVQYHSCAWSPYGETYNRNNNNEDEEHSAYWYIGNTQKYRANVAFSLYGVLKGEKDKGCRPGTFINSFFTRYGVDPFVASMKLNNYLGAGSDHDLFSSGNGYYTDDVRSSLGFSSQCVSLDENDGDQNNNNEYNDDYSGMGESLYPDTTSYSLGCSDRGHGFQIQQFRSSTCIRESYTGTHIDLSFANKMLDKLQCALLYDSSSSGYSFSEDDDNEHYNNNDDAVPELSYPVELLEYSNTCNVFVDSSCPDPYGRLRTYAYRLSRGNQNSIWLGTPFYDFARMTPQIFLILAGMVMLLIARCRSKAREGTEDLVVRPYSNGRDSPDLDNSSGSGSDEGNMKDVIHNAPFRDGIYLDDKSSVYVRRVFPPGKRMSLNATKSQESLGEPIEMSKSQSFPERMWSRIKGFRSGSPILPMTGSDDSEECQIVSPPRHTVGKGLKNIVVAMTTGGGGCGSPAMAEPTKQIASKSSKEQGLSTEKVGDENDPDTMAMLKSNVSILTEESYGHPKAPAADSQSKDIAADSGPPPRPNQDRKKTTASKSSAMPNLPRATVKTLGNVTAKKTGNHMTEQSQEQQQTQSEQTQQRIEIVDLEKMHSPLLRVQTSDGMSTRKDLPPRSPAPPHSAASLSSSKRVTTADNIMSPPCTQRRMSGGSGRPPKNPSSS